jgi:hypothetical protein
MYCFARTSIDDAIERDRSRIRERLATTNQTAYISTMLGKRDLRASLQRIGVQIPGLSHGGVLIDGKKKAELCADLGIEFEVYEARTLRDACSILWTRHPERALELAGNRPLLELAELCSTSTTAIALTQRATQKAKKPPNSKRLEGAHYPTLKQDPRMVRRLFVLEPELYAYAKEAAAQAGHRNVNRLVRESLWAKVAELVPLAPREAPQRVQAPNGARSHKRHASR